MGYVNRQSPLTAQEKKKRVYTAFDTSDRTGTQILYVKKQDGDNNDVYPYLLTFRL